MSLLFNETKQIVHVRQLLSWTLLLPLFFPLGRVLYMLFSMQLSLWQCSHLNPLQQVPFRFSWITDQRGHSRWGNSLGFSRKNKRIKETWVHMLDCSSFPVVATWLVSNCCRVTFKQTNKTPKQISLSSNPVGIIHYTSIGCLSRCWW